MNETQQFFQEIKQARTADTFVKLTLSKPIRKSADLENVYLREVEIQKEKMISFTYRFKTNDQVKNYSLDGAIDELAILLNSSFRIATLFTLEKDVAIRINKKGKTSIATNPPTFSDKLPVHHDKHKVKRVSDSEFLFHLGIKDKQGKLIPKMADKYKQINKYLEIIDDLLKSTPLPKKVNIVDMGSGKGYLTFALYDFLRNTRQLDIQVTGIELREELVTYCNEVAKKCGYSSLSFISERIENYNADRIDVLIALHACDTATDDAIYKGLRSKSSLIICAPCCHKQVRQSVKGTTQENPILKYGIFQERQFEMVTDTIRALILEKNQYNTKVFEFISNEHTRKNVMLVATKASKSPNIEAIEAKIEGLKKEYGVAEHYLETRID
ncbi:class I SAM-dependent methyltransferase [Marivirga harenae]|uniref:class I SAM-dependent methyltransferase n=1 Tax=Marivirga harenae TaxID=2010992 RepID=UPI0026E0301D|nr:SAM-dependent methyltransferase [Marivirga harenae]WKV12360.1 SAM-dependent methyltransferase [Marivirga harenae]